MEKTCREYLNRRLAACGWPPPLATAQDDWKSRSFWEELEVSEHNKLNELLVSMAAMNVLQVALAESSGEVRTIGRWIQTV